MFVHRVLDRCVGIALFSGCAMLATACAPNSASGGAPGSSASLSGAPAVQPTLPQGAWATTTADDAAVAGFATLTLAADGTWTETGRSDAELPNGDYGLATDITIDPAFGEPPPGMQGPFIDLYNTPDGDGDGEWYYGFAESADGTSLTLTLYADKDGQGLRWGDASTFNLSLVTN